MNTKYHIVILECDTPPTAIVEKEGRYGDIFERRLRDGIEHASNVRNVHLSFTKWDVVNARTYPAIDEVDAVLLSGSKYNSFDNDPWILQLIEFVKIAYNARKPLVGICFGHQIIARALGGNVTRSTKGWEVAVEKIDLTRNGSVLFGKDTLYLHQMHRDAVVEAPQSIEVLGSSPRCDVQVMHSPGRVLAVQGHPEFNAFITGQLVELRHEQGLFDDKLYEDATSRTSINHDGAVFWEVACRFLLAPQN